MRAQFISAGCGEYYIRATLGNHPIGQGGQAILLPSHMREFQGCELPTIRDDELNPWSSY
jgi:hypothetical protein